MGICFEKESLQNEKKKNKRPKKICTPTDHIDYDEEWFGKNKETLDQEKLYQDQNYLCEKKSSVKTLGFAMSSGDKSLN